MASLPSVVLGFVGALILAPFIENWVVAVLAAMALMPLAALTFGYLWQLLPRIVRLRYQRRLDLPLLMVSAGVAILVAVAIAGPIESDALRRRLQGLAGWRRQCHARAGAADLADRRDGGLARSARSDRRLVGSPAGAAAPLRWRLWPSSFASSACSRWAPAWRGWREPRSRAWGSIPAHALVGTFVQRNTLVVGFVMGFAVIPIIYTISEDALSSVPEHLRSASLACGATPWQTAIRVILPVAMSGIFSAVMIGLGRAVGETMIVVMAAGNTPVMDINIFNGLRALSANIVVEMPEAVKDSTLYRMLFLAALTLFAVTFVVNTVAEIVRMRFRKRAFQL